MEVETKEQLVLKSYLETGRGTLSDHSIEAIKNDLKTIFDAEGTILLDFEGIRAMSPSFAYNCFGKMYDSKDELENFLNNVEVSNDSRNIYRKIEEAVQRRIMFLD